MTQQDEKHIDLVSDPNDDSTGPELDEAGLDSITETSMLRKELEEAKNQKLRALAELENYRARSNRLIADERKYASIDLIRDMLNVWDNVGRALAAAESTHSIESLIDGVKLVDSQFYEVLKKYNCTKIEAMHQPFDPNFQASIAQMPNAEFPPNTVIEEVQSGFTLHDRVVRPAQVVLSSAVK